MPEFRIEIEHLIAALPPEARPVVAAALPEASRALSEAALVGWLEGIKLLLDNGSGLVPVITYLRSVHPLVDGGDETLLPQLVAVSRCVLNRSDARTLDAFLVTLPHVAQRLADGISLHGYLDLVDELAGLAPQALEPMLRRVGQLLDQAGLEGLRRWAVLGVQTHTSDRAAQQAWFGLESEDARAILLAAGAGTLFNDVERRLAFYVRALWAREPDLRPAAMRERQRGRRASIVNGTIRLPQTYETFPGVDQVSLYRAAAAHAAAHLIHSTQQFPLRALRPIQVVLIGLIEDARVERLAMHEMPGLEHLWRPFHVALPSGALTAVSLLARLARALFDDDYRDESPFVAHGRALFTENLARLHEPAVSRDIGNILGNDLGRMRVQFNFNTFLIEPLYRDDNLFLWDLGDAGQQRSDDEEVVYQAVRLSQGRGGEQTDLEREEDGGDGAGGQSLQRGVTARGEQAAAEDAPVHPYHYDEWDYLIGMDRPAWCTLLEKAAPSGDPRTIEVILRRNEETLNRLTSLIKAVQIQRPKRLKRQLEGDRLDIDASIAATVDMRSGRTPDPRVHQRPARNSRDLAVLLLLDLSQSTNDWVPSAGTTVLNLAREATALVAHAMDQLDDEFAIHGFDSNGRHEIEYYRFKDFETPYDEDTRARLAGMKGQLSTRMGTALRHAGHLLGLRRAAHRLVLLLTDGEPHDIDVHDKLYLVHDTKHAVEDLRRDGVATFCITLDQGADEYVARIFGAHNYLVLDQLKRLPERLPSLYLRLTA